MASTTDPHAAGFDATKFRSAITFAMNMGTPETSSQRLKFVFEESVAYLSSEKRDPTGVPYNLNASEQAVTSEYCEVEVPVALEFISRSSQGRDTNIGYMQPSHVNAFILDTDIADVQGADYALIDERRYEILSWNPPIGLFDVTVHSVLLEAVDQS